MGVPQKWETSFRINFPHISIEISCNQGNFKKLWKYIRENMKFYRFLGNLWGNF